MNQFSVYNYTYLPQQQKADFNKLLSNKLLNHIDEINNDDVLRFVGINATNSDLEDAIVTELYSRVASGIQAGSGNQNLFVLVLSLYTESWLKIAQ